MQTDTQRDGGEAPNRPESAKGAEFRITALQRGAALLIGDVVAFNVAGKLCATDAKCPPLGGPLNEGSLLGSTMTCPWHGPEVDVCTGEVLHGPAKESVKTLTVIVEGNTGRLEPGK
jgi:nitrite reductase/ring-hydroxylating ferredoxin subunit